MKTRKTFLACVILMLSCIVAKAYKYTDEFGTTFYFDVNKNGIATIYEMNGKTDRVRIPSQVKNKKGQVFNVKTLDFYRNARVKGLNYNTTVMQIEDGIEYIKEDCFASFSKLYEVYLPSSLLVVEKNAFVNGKNISFPTIPAKMLATDLRAGKQSLGYDPIVSEKKDPIDPSIPTKDDNRKKNVAVIRQRGEAGKSDVDVFIPSSGIQRDQTFCLIMANEKYSNRDTPNVDWASTDGDIFYKYCRTTLGIPQENIRMVKDADYLSMKKQIDWLSKVSKLYGSNAKFIVYYAGHGAPDDKGNCYLIPRNGSINDITTGYKLNDIYGILGSLTAQSALVLVDACFSGTDRHDMAMTNKRGIARVQKQEVSGRVVAITATSGEETAMAYDEKAHGLFTYYVLKALQEKRGNISYGELYDYVKDNVGKKASLLMDKEQTPSVSAGNLGDNWRNIKF